MQASAIVNNVSKARMLAISQQVLVYLKTLPVSIWRNAVFVVAGVWILHSLSTLIWLLIGAPKLDQPDTIALPIQSASTSSVSINLAKLQELKLFGDGSVIPVEVEEVADETEQDYDDAATTRLNLKLHGVVVSNEVDSAGAIIEEAGSQSFYVVGEELTKNSGVKVTRVLDQRVILDNRGSLESLWLYSEADFKKSRSNTATRKSVPLNRSAAVSTQPANTITKKISAKQVPKSVGDVVRFSLHREGGQVVGYRVRPARDRALFDQLGLKTGDIVTAVNGIALDPSQIRTVYNEIRTAPQALLSIKRGDENLSINISLDSYEN